MADMTLSIAFIGMGVMGRPMAGHLVAAGHRVTAYLLHGAPDDAQGLDLIREASIEYGWAVEMAVVAKIWRAGCIIRARLLDRIHNEYAAQSLTTLLEAKSVAEDLGKVQTPWRTVVIGALKAGLPVPGFSSALAYYDSIRAPRLNAALTQ